MNHVLTESEFLECATAQGQQKFIGETQKEFENRVLKCWMTRKKNGYLTPWRRHNPHADERRDTS